jgi:rod shape-determining protein MreC
MIDSRAKLQDRVSRAAPLMLIAASLLSLTISTRSLAGLPERTGLSILGFFQRGFSIIGDFVADTVSSIAELRELRRDYDALRLEIERFGRLERDYADIKAENQRLKEQLGYGAELPYERIPAKIAAKDPGNLYATIVIDKGISEGIRKNMPVVAFQDGVEGLVGRVLEVGRGTSIIVPVYDGDAWVAARLAKTRHEGLVVGSGGADLPLVMKYVKKRAKDEVQFGDLVITTGFESVYPADIAIGRVTGFKAPDWQTSIDIELEPIIDFSRVEYLFVIKPGSGGAPATGKDGAP